MGGTKCLRLGTCELEDMGGVLQNDSSITWTFFLPCGVVLNQTKWLVLVGLRWCVLSCVLSCLRQGCVRARQWTSWRGICVCGVRQERGACAGVAASSTDRLLVGDVVVRQRFDLGKACVSTSESMRGAGLCVSHF